MNWTGGIVLELLTEAEDGKVCRASARKGAISPDLLVEGLARDRLSVGLPEQAKDLRLLAGQSDALLTAGQLLRAEVDENGADLKGVRQGTCNLLRGVRTGRAWPSKQTQSPLTAPGLSSVSVDRGGHCAFSLAVL